MPLAWSIDQYGCSVATSCATVEDVGGGGGGGGWKSVGYCVFPPALLAGRTWWLLWADPPLLFSPRRCGSLEEAQAVAEKLEADAEAGMARRRGAVGQGGSGGGGAGKELAS